MTWEELLSRFAASGRLSPLTIKNTRSALKFLRRFRESAGPHELETSHLQEFYREQRRSVSTRPAPAECGRWGPCCAGR